MTNFLKKTTKKIFQKLTNKKLSNLEYWEHRVKVHGKQAVLNIGYSDTEFEMVT